MAQVQTRQITVEQYKVLEEIGRGKMSIVYRAHDPRAQRDVALKLLPRGILLEDKSRIEFEKTAQQLTTFDYSGIVPVTDFGEYNGQPFLVMRYMRGKPLAEQMQMGPMSIIETARYVETIAPALTRAHQRGIIHGDLNPSNVLFDGLGNAALSDFAIAKFGRPFATVSGIPVHGSPEYIAPEVGRLDGISPLNDVYALGCLVYHMLVGVPPFTGDTPIEILRGHIEKPIPNVRTARPDLPESVQHVISGALRKNPRERYQSPDEVNRGLIRIVENEIGLSEEELFAAAYPAPPNVTPQPMQFGENDTIPDWYTPSEKVTTAAYSSPQDMLATTPVGSPYSPRPIGAPQPAQPIGAAQEERELSATERRRMARRERRALGAWRAAQARRAGMNEFFVRLAGFTMPPVIQWSIFAALVAVFLVWLQVANASEVFRCEVLDQGCPTPIVIPTSTPAQYPTAIPTVAADIEQLSGHGEATITTLDFSSNGEFFASGGDDGQIIIWNTETWQQQSVLSGHSEGITKVAFRPGGSLLASGSKDTTVRLWDAETGVGLPAIRAHVGSVDAIAWSDDGSLLASGSADRRVFVWDVSPTGTVEQRTAIFLDETITRIDFIDNERLAIGTNTHVILYSFAGDFEITRQEIDNTVISLTVSPTGERLAVGTVEQLLLLSAQTLSRLEVIQAVRNRPFIDLEWGPDGQLLADATFQSTAIRDLETGAILREYVGDQPVTAVAWSEDAARVATGGIEGQVIVWDYRVTPLQDVNIAPQDVPESLTESITASNIDRFGQWKWLGGHADLIRDLAFNADGMRLFSGSNDGRLFAWNITSGRTLPAFNRGGGFSKWVTNLAYHPGGQVLVNAYVNDQLLTVWNPESGQGIPASLPNHIGGVGDMHWSPDGETLAASLVGNGTIRLWGYDQESGTFAANPRILRGQTQPATALAFSADSARLVSAPQGTGELIVWNVNQGQPLGDPIEIGGLVNDLVWAPSSRILVASGSDVVLVDPELNQVLETYPDEEGRAIISVTWVAGGDLIMAGADDGRLLVLDSSLNLLAVHTLPGDHGPLQTLTVSPESVILGAGYSDGLIVLWGIIE